MIRNTIAKAFLISILVACSACSLHARPKEDITLAKNEKGREDSNLYSGELGNGLRFILVKRRSDAFADSSRVALRMRVAGGWQAEASGQNGLNHLIEHLARGANGSLSPQEVAAFRDKGTVVREWGAFTSPYTTEYFLTTLSNDEKSIGNAFRYFAGIARNLRISKETVHRERQIVMDEMSSRLPRAERLYRRAKVLAPGSEWDVSRGYNSTDVPTASIETIASLYQRVYRPENITIVIVGDIEVVKIRRLLLSSFGDWRPARDHPVQDKIQSSSDSPDAKNVDSGDVWIARPFTTVINVPGQPAVLASFRTSYFGQREGTSRREHAVLSRVITHILKHRLRLQSIEAGLATTSFMIDDTAWGPGTYLWQARPRNGEWRKALSILLDQVEAVRGGEFTQRELSIAKQLVQRDISDRRELALSYSNSQVSARISMDMIRRYRVLSDTDRLSAERSFLEAITLRKLNGIWRSDAGNFALQTRLEGIGEQKEGSRLEEELESFVASYNPSPLPFVEESEESIKGQLAFPSGAVVDDVATPNGVRSLTFANGAKLRLIKRNHTGKFLELSVSAIAPKARADLTFCDSKVLATFVRAGGARKHSEPQIIDARWGKDVRLSPFEVTPNGIAISASVRHDDVTYAFRELFAYFSDPAFNQSGNEVALERIRQVRSTLDQDPVGAVLEAYEHRLATNSSEPDALSKSDCVRASSMTRAALKLRPILSKGQINVAVSGNMDENEIIDLFARSFGQVQKDAEFLDFNNSSISHDLSPMIINLQQNNIGKQVVGFIWPLPQVSNSKDLAKQNLLTAFLARLTYVTLAEKGTNYAPRVERRRLNLQNGPFVIVAAVATSHDNAREILARMNDVSADLMKSPADRDLFETVRDLVIDGDLRSYNEDRVWAYLAAHLSHDPDIVANWRGSAEATKHISEEEVSKLARETFIHLASQVASPIAIQ